MDSKYDFNVLEKAASALMAERRFDDALRIYFYMADGDGSLDGGYLGQKIGECYEQKGDLSASKYWHSRAVEENPQVRTSSAEAIQRLAKMIDLSDLLQER